MAGDRFCVVVRKSNIGTPVVRPREGIELDEARRGGDRGFGAVALPGAGHCDID
jgi:hypothetical protein